MEIYSIKPYFQKALSPIASVFIKLKVHPTVINFSALLISIISGVLLFFYKNYNFFLLIIPIAVFIRIALNALDGMVARGLNVSSYKGEIYNEFFDRLSDVSIFLGLALSFVISVEGKMINYKFYVNLSFILGLIFIFLVLLNSYLGILCKSAGGKRLYIGLLGKADRMFYLSVTCLIYFFYDKEIVWIIFYIIMLILIIISIGQRLWKSLKSLENI